MNVNYKKLKKVREIEQAINKNLFVVCSITTLAVMAMTTVNFFDRGRFSPTNMGFFYIMVVLIYSAHKELVRWLGEKRGHRHGEYFVYAWIILTTALYVINFFSNNYYSYSIEGYALSTLADISYLTMEVLGVFVATRIIKVFFMLKK